jgi:hypothetical protein
VKTTKGVSMFDFNKLGDLSKVASQAKDIQAQQERSQREQLDLLKKISGQIDQVIDLLKKR